jgi:adenylate cyclase
MHPREYAALGLYDTSRPDPARLELLDFLTAQGVTAGEIATAERTGRLASIFTDRLAGAPCLTLKDVARRAGQPPELVARVWRAAGFPDPDPQSPVFTESDAEALAVFGLGVGVFGQEAALQLVRVIGSALARIAEAELSTAMANVAGAFFPTAASPLEGLRTSASLLSLWPDAELAIGQLLRRHVVTANRRLEEMQPSASGSEVRHVAVGFADLIGSTRLSVELPWAEYASAMAEFEASTTDLVTFGGARVVKLMGDEVMFVASGVNTVAHVAFTLIEAFTDHAVLPGLRIGLAAGPAIARDGDYFGTVVHLAARLVDLAEPGTIVVSEEVAKVAVADGLHANALGSRAVQGFPDPLSVFLLMRRQTGSGAPPSYDGSVPTGNV